MDRQTKRQISSLLWSQLCDSQSHILTENIAHIYSNRCICCWHLSTYYNRLYSGVTTKM